MVSTCSRDELLVRQYHRNKWTATDWSYDMPTLNCLGHFHVDMDSYESDLRFNGCRICMRIEMTGQSLYINVPGWTEMIVLSNIAIACAQRYS